MTRSRAVVIGGGVSGLATASLLARDGHEVTLVERRPVLGGRAGSWERDGFVFDTGPSWYLMPEVFEHFYRMVGSTTAEHLRLVDLDPGYRVYGEPSEGAADNAIDVRAGRDAVAALFEGREPGAGRRARRYLRSATRAYEAARTSYLYNPFSSWRTFLAPSVLKNAPAILPLLSRSLWTMIRRRFADRRLRQILGYPAVFLGTSPFDAPALYHLMSHMDLVDGVRYPLGGFRRFADSLVEIARENGVTIETACEAVAIRRDASHVRGVDVEQSGGRRVLEADIVVSAIDEHHTETVLLAESDRSYPKARWRNQVTGPGAVLVMLGVADELPQLRHHTLLFSNDWRDNFDAIFGDTPRVPDTPSFYVCMPSATDDAVAPSGHENLFLLVPVPPDVTIGRGGVGGYGDPAVTKIADRAIEQLSAWAGIPDLTERIVVRRTVGPGDFADDFHSYRGSALGPAHTLRQSAFLRGRTRSRRVPGLYYTGATSVPGVGVPMCLIGAELVLKHVRGDSSVGPLEEP
ncbi:phytoene desaturase family protein [Microbacterium karelineae]|uniref:phytoene desaturase family protein n=1 Tax=Microbacterium karelineae TaxID=2654283 RepID=UPI0018D378A9|nr:phytoene desaturase family protein [Microbacterium karelineae]